MTDPILPVARALMQLAAGPVRKQAQRHHQAVQVLRKAGLAGATPPPDFPSVYAWALAEYGSGKPPSVVKLLASEWARVPFQQAFATGDYSRVRRVLREVIDGHRETGEFQQLHASDIDELDGFIAEFQRQVAATRSPAHVMSDLKLDQLLEKVEHAKERQEAYRQEREPARREQSSLQRLCADITEWLGALNYPVLEVREDEPSWVVRAPITPGHFGRLLILAVDGELQPSHVSQARTLQQREAAAGAWVIAQRRISPAARQDGAVLCLTFDDLVDMAADFEPYLDWLDREVERRGLPGRYVRLSCRRDDLDEGVSSEYDWRMGGLDEYAHRWLADPAKEHLSVLGAFGSGKSWFSLHLAWELAKLWREARDRGLPRPRMPLLIPLRDYAKAADIDAVISKFLFGQDLRLGMPVFQYLNRTGRLLLIFDGFDEMASRVDRQTMVSNFWELATVVQPGAKVLLSSRTEHFPTAEETRRVLSGEVFAAAAPPQGEVPRFDIVELMPLDDEQIDLVLRGRTDDDKVVQLVTRNRRVLDLLRRPVMSDLVLTALPEIRAGEVIDVARIYLYAIRHKLDEDIKAERTFTSRADKLYFLSELAWEMVSTSTLTMNYRAFPERVRAYFGGAIAADREVDHWVNDMSTQTLLIRDASGDYTPAHRSLLEWLVAYKFAAELGVLDGRYLELLGTVTADGASARWSAYFTAREPDGTLAPISAFVPEAMPDLANTLGSMALDFAVSRFLRAMARECPDGVSRISAIARATADVPPGGSGMVGANCVSVAIGLSDGLSLSGAVLTGLTSLHLPRADLRGADLRGVKLGRVRLTGADLTGALLDQDSFRSAFDGNRLLAITGSGAVVTHYGSIKAWIDGDLGRAPTFIAVNVMPDDRSVKLLALEGSRFYCRTSRPEVIDAATGERAPARQMTWAVAVDWRGRAAVLTDSAEEGAVEVLAASDLAVIDRLPKSPLQKRNPAAALTYAPGEGVCCIAQSSGAIHVQAYEDSGGWGPIGSWHRTAQGPLRLDGAYVWTEAEPGHVILCDLHGSPIWTPGDAVGVPVGSLVLTDHQIVLVSVADGLAAWPLSGGPPLWQVPLLRGARTLIAHPDGDSFVYFSGSEEIGRRRIDTGDVVSRSLVHSRFREAKFSRDSGLDAVVLDVLELGGAVFG